MKWGLRTRGGELTGNLEIGSRITEADLLAAKATRYSNRELIWASKASRFTNNEWSHHGF